MKSRLAVMMALAIAGSAHGQSVTTGAVHGRVTELGTQEPLPGTIVHVAGASGAMQTAITDTDGTYKVTELVPGEYTVTFDFNGIVIARKDVRISANETTPVFQTIG